MIRFCLSIVMLATLSACSVTSSMVRKQSSAYLTHTEKMQVAPYCEQSGEATIDFAVTIPKELLGSAKRAVVIPQVHANNKTYDLGEIVVRGEMFRKVQRRHNWLYARSVRRSSATNQYAFERYVKYPYVLEPHLDSLVRRAREVTYHYSQSVKCEDDTEFAVTVSGAVYGLDGVIYILPESDTLSYRAIPYEVAQPLKPLK